MLSEIPSWLRTTPLSYTKPAPPRIPELVTRGGPVWDRLVDAARATGHRDPEKMAESMFQVREKALALKAAQHRTVVVPFQAEKKPLQHKEPKAIGTKCKATTLANKPCPYKATFCGYCSKHLPSDAVLKLSRK